MQKLQADTRSNQGAGFGSRRCAPLLLVACAGATGSYSAGAAAPARVALTLKENSAFVPVEISGRTILLQLDLGADDELGLTEAALREITVTPTEGTRRHYDAKRNVLPSVTPIMPQA